LGGVAAGGDQPPPVGGEPAGDASASLDASLPTDATVTDRGAACDGPSNLPDAGDAGPDSDGATDAGVTDGGGFGDRDGSRGAEDGALGDIDGAVLGLDCQRP
jgi:hypothetical protein